MQRNNKDNLTKTNGEKENKGTQTFMPDKKNQLRILQETLFFIKFLQTSSANANCALNIPVISLF